MPTFDNNPNRIDPYKNFKFKVYFEGNVVAGVNKVSALKRTTEVIEHRSGGDSSTVLRSPGQTKYEAITLEQGITADKTFEQWANKVWYYSGGEGTEVSLADFRKDITIVLHNEAGQEVLKWNVYRCWVSEFQALSELDASGNAVAIGTLKLENEGWERDSGFVQGVPEPSFTEPT
ncbi:MAG: phage tail protein [Nannocystaceae bacterium]